MSTPTMPVKRREGPTKQRQISLRRSIDPLPLATPTEPTKLQERRASEGKSKRPPRWRGPQQNHISSQRTAPTVLPERDCIPARELQKSRDQRPSKPQNIELRLSFSQSLIQDVERQLHSENNFNHSFSGLSMTTSASQSSSSSSSQSTTKASPVQPVQLQSSIFEPPLLTKPGKKREGYGFSYSETFMYDSDDYPDTECEWDPEAEEQETELSTPTSDSMTSYLNWNNTQHSQHTGQSHSITRPTSRDSTTTTTTTPSFDDLVVLRSTGSFHLTRPTRHRAPLPCTPATPTDALLLRQTATALLSKFSESSSIQLALLTRLERMLYLEQNKFGATEDSVGRSLKDCAERLRDWLVGSRGERIETGEWRGVVDHEIEWGEWLVEACGRGVLHVRRRGCRCRPDWEGDWERVGF